MLLKLLAPRSLCLDRLFVMLSFSFFFLRLQIKMFFHFSINAETGMFPTLWSFCLGVLQGLDACHAQDWTQNLPHAMPVLCHVSASFHSFLFWFFWFESYTQSMLKIYFWLYSPGSLLNEWEIIIWYKEWNLGQLAWGKPLPSQAPVSPSWTLFLMPFPEILKSFWLESWV